MKTLGGGLVACPVAFEPSLTARPSRGMGGIYFQHPAATGAREGCGWSVSAPRPAGYLLVARPRPAGRIQVGR